MTEHLGQNRPQNSPPIPANPDGNAPLLHATRTTFTRRCRRWPSSRDLVTWRFSHADEALLLHELGQALFTRTTPSTPPPLSTPLHTFPTQPTTSPKNRQRLAQHERHLLENLVLGPSFSNVLTNELRHAGLLRGVALDFDASTLHDAVGAVLRNTSKRRKTRNR